MQCLRFFVILFGQRFALVFAEQLSAISRLAKSERYNAQEVLTAHQVDEDLGSHKC